jgi:hypothetical protein
MAEKPLNYTLNDYLWGNCAIAQTAHDVSPDVVKQANGSVFLIPSSSEAGDITRVLKEGYDVRLLRNGLRDLVKDLNLDYVFVDTHPGLNEETLLSIAISNILLVILRPDRQDFQGTVVTVDLARKLRVYSLHLCGLQFLFHFRRASLHSVAACPHPIPLYNWSCHCQHAVAGSHLGTKFQPIFPRKPCPSFAEAVESPETGRISLSRRAIARRP